MSKTIKIDGKDFVRFDNPSVSRHSLRKGQATLYELLASKVQKNTVVTYDEAHKIWTEQVCRNKIGNKPASWVWRYDHQDGSYRSVLEVMSDDLIKMTVIGWLTRTIGVLVMKDT